MMVTDTNCAGPVVWAVWGLLWLVIGIRMGFSPARSKAKGRDSDILGLGLLGLGIF